MRGYIMEEIIMKFELVKNVFEKIEKILKDETMFPNPTNTWEALVHYKYQVFTRYVPIPDEDKDDWRKILDTQIEFLREFISTSIKFGFMPPLNAEGSLISIAAYNATIEKSNVEEGIFNIPSAHEIRQEFYKLLMEKDI